MTLMWLLFAAQKRKSDVTIRLLKKLFLRKHVRDGRIQCNATALRIFCAIVALPKRGRVSLEYLNSEDHWLKEREYIDLIETHKEKWHQDGLHMVVFRGSEPAAYVVVHWRKDENDTAPRKNHTDAHAFTYIHGCIFHSCNMLNGVRFPRRVDNISTNNILDAIALRNPPTLYKKEHSKVYELIRPLCIKLGIPVEPHGFTVSEIFVVQA